MHYCFTLKLTLCLLLLPSYCFAQSDPVEQLERFLTDNPFEKVAQQSFANVALTKSQSARAEQVLLQARLKQLEKERAKEWEDKVITYGDQTMKFDYRVFGDKPENGRSLFISMHGGGGAPARVNDQQWRNQIGLYEPAEGVYLAPRAPTDTWNLWHQGHIDPMFTRIIEDAILFAEVDPNRVFLMGYSAGGDGVYQLAPRMADQLAAAAMMAGHPNDAKPFGLRNIGFTLHMGGKDAAYKRNEVARQWKKRLAELKEADPDGYSHEVVIHEEHGHWMKRDDAVAVEWMSNFNRDPMPAKVVWYQSGVTHNRFYWLAVDEPNQKRDSHVVVTRDGQNFVVEKAKGLEALQIQLNDQLTDLDQPIRVSFGDQVMELKAERKIATIASCLTERTDPSVIYSARVEVELR